MLNYTGGSRQGVYMKSFIRSLAQHKIGVAAVIAFAVVAFAQHGWFAG